MDQLQQPIDDFVNTLGDWSISQVPNLGLRLLGILFILLVGRWLIGIARRALERALRRSEMEETLISFLSRLLNIALLALMFIIVLGMLGIPTTSVIAILGAGTLAIGLALQDTLGNLASGILLIVLRPYRVGEIVEVADAVGVVEEIRFFHTILRTPDNSVLFIPNSDIMDNNITNFSEMEWRRVDLIIGIGYEDDLRQAKQILNEILTEDERIAIDPAPTVAVMELADSSVNFAVRPYVQPSDYLSVRFDLIERIKLRFDAAGISIPYPQRDVHVYQN